MTMIMIYFRTKRDRDEMVRKAHEMEKFAAEFAECLEQGEEDYEHEYSGDTVRDGEVAYRVGKHTRLSRYSY